MIISDEGYKTTFEVPDNPKGKVLLAYDHKIEDPTGGSMYERLWAGLCAVVTDWKSEIIPSLDPNILDTELTGEQIELVKWAGLAAFTWARNRKTVEKN